MRLKQLKLAGFKSFANPTTFHFPKTITAIVGPNGCGKSNVIDAIRWVLGESSAKQLRGGAMSDVIFAGTQDKSAKSLASVELVFEHTRGEDGSSGIHHALNLYQELSVRRQINKEGKSDYFINGTKVRRRDVVDIFLGTGLGARSYAVIEQGMIGRIIDANALQLREFIEEASGVSRYQSRRDDTQKQLDTASDNLARLHDMVSELTSQQKRLEKQAKTAQQAQQWQQAQQAISEQLLIDDYGQAWQKQQTLAADFQAMRERVDAQQVLIEGLIEQQQLAQQAVTEQQHTLQTQQNLAKDYWQQQHETQSLLKQAEQALANDQQRLNILNVELGRFAKYQQELQAQKQQAQMRIEGLPDQLEQLTTQLQQLRKEQDDCKQQREHIAKNLVALNNQKQDVEKNLAVSENALKHHASQQQRQQQRQSEHDKAVLAWQTANAKFDQQFAAFENNELDTQMTRLSDEIERLEANIIARQESIADQADEVDSLTHQHRQAEQQYQAWQTEHATLQNLLAQQETALDQVIHQSANQENISSLPKLISQLQLTETGKGYANIFDTLVTVFAKWSIAADQDFAQIIHDHAVFIDNQSTLPSPSNNHTANSQLIEGCLPLSALIAAPNLAIFQQVWISATPLDWAEVQDKGLLDSLPTGDWLLVQTSAQQLILCNQQLLINLSHLLHEGQQVISFSQQLMNEARIEELDEHLAQQQPQLQRLANRLQQARVSLQEWQAQDRTARNQLLSLTQQQQQCQQQKLQQQYRYQSALDKLNQDKKRLDSDSERLQQEGQDFADKLQQEQQRFYELSKTLSHLQPQLQQQISERQSLDERLNQFASQQRELEQQQNRITQTLATGQLQITASEQQLAKACQDQARLTSEQQLLSHKISEQQARLPQLQQQLAVDSTQLQTANDSVTQLTITLKTMETKVQQAQLAVQESQQQLSQLQQQYHTTDTAWALAKQNVALIGEQLTSRKIAVPKTDDIELLGSPKREQLQRQLEQLASQLVNLGAVNHAAVAELSEVNSRLAPLAEQISDLTASIDKLQLAIQQIDSQTKQLFMDMLSQVNIELNKLFTQVFGGGQAKLVLSDHTNVKDGSGKGWQSGLELMAQPKGKKNSRLALLSGGEKTLTALSLIFAIFKQQPAPFCVLDEVDAPLDDANVARFTRLIEQLAKDVQFVFISHNKLAMQIADELKGVTMPTAGVSKLVSVDMAEVEAYLA
ncbi:chromosome segregation protein SMC [Moraxella osloensis]|uniref:Chromosome partition protein Smc n=1 Tax=Faucicola osloensis TaxID=34062 RepID=A0A2D2LVK5_FAUOS|nr:chromosome segregation protein SMC [Moraxella osloensis]ATR79044.1 chromosome segregation protein SMC [Moraxella osloensis]